MYLVLSIIGGGQHEASHAFGPEGGVIGRSASCDWTLPDPTNTISGRHAQIGVANGQYVLTDTSTNGTFLNGAPTPIGKGQAAPIQPGDRIVIGDFVIAVQLSPPAAHQASAARPAGNGHSGARPVAGGHSGDILGRLAGNGGGAPSDPLAALAPTAGGAALQGARAGRTVMPDMTDLVGPGAPAGGISPLPPAGIHASNAAGQEPVPAASADTGGDSSAMFPDHLSVDYLLSGSQPVPPVSEQPVPAAQPAVPPVAQPPVTSAGADAPGHDLSPALRASYVAIGGEAPPSGAPPRQPAIDPVSILRQRSEGRSRARGAAPMPSPPAGPPVAMPAPVASSAPGPMPAPVEVPDSAGAPPPLPVALSPAIGQAAADQSGNDAAAFWAGLGVDPDNVPEERRAELLAEVGRSLRELGQGLVEILAARRSLKDEFRMDQTRLQATENNPFKFFGSGEKALARIIVGEDGYMALDEAVRESLRDIKAHEVAAMAAMQAAVTHVLRELDPQALARSVGQRGVFGGEDKKALWDRFVELHAGIAGDAEGASKGVVTQAFMEAYERQLSQMRGEGQ